MSSRTPLYFVGLLSLCTVVALYYAALDTVNTLSPQGCRMSWMSPSYVLQSGFDRSWTPLAGRYSLWLYREAGWEGHEVRYRTLNTMYNSSQCLSCVDCLYFSFQATPAPPTKCGRLRPPRRVNITLTRMKCPVSFAQSVSNHWTSLLVRVHSVKARLGQCAERHVKSNLMRTYPHFTGRPSMRRENTLYVPLIMYYPYTLQIRLSSSSVTPWEVS